MRPVDAPDLTIPTTKTHRPQGKTFTSLADTFALPCPQSPLLLKSVLLRNISIPDELIPCSVHKPESHSLAHTHTDGTGSSLFVSCSKLIVVLWVTSLSVTGWFLVLWDNLSAAFSYFSQLLQFHSVTGTTTLIFAL